MTARKKTTAAERARQAATQRERSARRRAANERMLALPEYQRTLIRNRAQTLEARHTGPRVAAVTFLERALDEHDQRAAKAAARRAQAKEPKEPAERRRPKGPQEKSRPKEAGRPEPETKALAGAAKARRGAPSVAAVVTVAVPDGQAYCAGCDSVRPEPEFWPERRTDKSKRRRICRACYNREWREWDARRRDAAKGS